MREGEMGNSTATTPGIGAEDFAAVYDRHRSRVYAQCLRRLRSPADADDATQVTFLRAFTAMNRGSGPRRLGPWLATIARNECSDRLSSAGKAVPMDMSELPLADDGPPPDAGLLAEAEGAEVRAALGQLPFAQRSVLHLREVCELSYQEVADRLAMPVTAVETLLFRARTNLREEVLAVRSPVKCHRARHLGEAVRDGDPITSLERKLLRNHRSECALCSWLPVRRARGARAAAILVATAAAAGARRLIVAPVADALVSAGAPAKTAAVALTAGSMAAGGLAVERPRPESRSPERPAAQVRKAEPRKAPAAAKATPSATTASAETTIRPASSTARSAASPTGRAGRSSSPTAPAVERQPAKRPERQRPARREQAQPREDDGGYDRPEPRSYEPTQQRRYAPPPAQDRQQPAASEAVRQPCVRGEGASGPGPAPSGEGPGAHSVTTG
ncbi:MAG TPA: sigma-70 family RNA polymerase sigma factor [Thermoleophilaceae bacterium]|nr:sigma-70 family RNA polymerase sigma factor [Thermoleophilaceae bacterium]